ncbi:MAG: hypothetical protein ACKN9T_09525, partial [Candidatus Methylumidiphilus sp.]
AMVALMIGFLGLLLWHYRLSIHSFIRPSYEDLLQQKIELENCVTHWRYANGSFVPQHKRQRMFHELRKLSRTLRSHPDNPNNKASE